MLQIKGLSGATPLLSDRAICPYMSTALGRRSPARASGGPLNREPYRACTERMGVQARCGLALRLKSVMGRLDRCRWYNIFLLSALALVP